MKTILAAIVVLGATGGIAAAQEAPMLIGKLSASVADQYNGGTVIAPDRTDRTGGAAIRAAKRRAEGRSPLVPADPMPHTGR